MSFYNDALQQNNTELQSNNTDLQGLLDTINALPVAKPEQTKTATPSLSQQNIVPDSGKVLSGVIVEPITSTLLTSLDADFKADNIAEGVDLFGVVGAFVGGVKFASGTITANSKTVTITGLGFTPQHAMLAADSVNTGQLSPILCALNNKGIYDYSSALKSITTTFTFTDGGFTVVSSGTGGGYSFVGNYTWVAWAE